MNKLCRIALVCVALLLMVSPVLAAEGAAAPAAGAAAPLAAGAAAPLAGAATPLTDAAVTQAAAQSGLDALPVLGSLGRVTDHVDGSASEAHSFLSGTPSPSASASRWVWRWVWWWR